VIYCSLGVATEHWTSPSGASKP